MLQAARKDTQVVTSEWQRIQRGISGVAVHEVLHVPRDHGVITEVFRPEWDPDRHAGGARLSVAPLSGRDWRVELPRQEHRPTVRQSGPAQDRALRRPRAEQHLPTRSWSCTSATRVRRFWSSRRASGTACRISARPKR